MMKHKRRVALLLTVATIFTLCVGSLALFTDRVSGSATATAGSLELNLANFQASKTAEFKPTEGINISYTISNKGNKSADIRENIVLTYTPASGVTSKINANNPEFALYNASDVTLNAAGVVTSITSGATPLTEVSSDGTQITYEAPQFILNGTGTAAETETGGVNARTNSYVLVFGDHADNSFQGATLKLEYEAQAKQHRNTDDSTWATVKTETITFGGDATHKAVPEK